MVEGDHLSELEIQKTQLERIAKHMHKVSTQGPPADTRLTKDRMPHNVPQSHRDQEKNDIARALSNDLRSLHASAHESAPEQTPTERRIFGTERTTKYAQTCCMWRLWLSDWMKDGDLDA